MNPVRKWVLLLVGLALGAAGTPVLGQVQTFINDFAGFQAAAGPLSMIDFETLPDGSPSVAGTAITAAFNYDDYGAHFSTPVSVPFIAGNTSSGFDLFAFSQFPQLTRIDVELVSPARAVGIVFPGGTRLSVYDAAHELIIATQYNSSGRGFFLGVISDTPIQYATINRGSDIEDIQSFVFQTIPEPCSGCLVLFGAVLNRLRVARSRK